MLGFIDGGYTIYFTPGFTAYVNAVAAYKRALTTWRCATRVNFNADDVNPYPGSADGVCLVRFSDLPIGVGSTTKARTTFQTALCGEDPNVDYSYLPDFLMQFNKNIVWHTGENMPNNLNWNDYSDPVNNPLQGDLQSTALHELGHAHMLMHTCNATNTMVSPGPDNYRRGLNNDDEDGGSHVSLLSNSVADPDCPAIGMTLINLADCDITPIVEIEGAFVNVSVFPNPTSGELKVELEASVNVNGTIDIVGSSGKTALSFKVNSKFVNINVQDLAMGIYHLVYRGDSGKRTFIGKFTKQ